MFGGDDYVGGGVAFCVDGGAYTVFAEMSRRKDGCMYFIHSLHIYEVMEFEVMSLTGYTAIT
jgi:hypothetical protein